MTKRWAKVDTAGRVTEIVEDDAKPDLEPGYDYRPATDQTKVGDNLGQPNQGQGPQGQAPGQTGKPQPK